MKSVKISGAPRPREIAGMAPTWAMQAVVTVTGGISERTVRILDGVWNMAKVAGLAPDRDDGLCDVATCRYMVRWLTDAIENAKSNFEAQELSVLAAAFRNRHGGLSDMAESVGDE